MTTPDFSDIALPDIPGGWREDEVVVGERTYRLAVPVDPDLLLDLPETLAEHNADDYMPYWAWLWPAATNMARWVAKQQWPDGLRTLELGCGMGLVGMVAVNNGLNVTLSDYRAEAITLVDANLRLNQISANTQVIDWRKQPTVQWPNILSCDVLYEVSNHAAIIDFIAKALPPEGTCWIGDPGRQHAQHFINSAHDDGRLRVELQHTNDEKQSAVVAGEFCILHVTRCN